MLKQHNQDVIPIILNEYKGLMSYIIRNTVKLTTEEQEECISDALYSLWKKRERFDENKSSFKSWLVLLTRHCAIDYYRKNHKYQKTLLLEDVSSANVYTESFKKMSIETIIELLQELPPPDNHIFYDKFIIGEDMVSISNKYQMSSDSIYKRIQRGRKKLKVLFQKEGF
jgi:RNA polymerase sigma-70 factor (ECF subfamily)